MEVIFIYNTHNSVFHEVEFLNVNTGCIYIVIIVIQNTK